MHHSKSSQPACWRERCHQALAIVLSIAVIIGTTPVPIYALPSGAEVVHGNASLSINGGNLTITTGDRVIINYNDFSIGSGELVRSCSRAPGLWL